MAAASPIADGSSPGCTCSAPHGSVTRRASRCWAFVGTFGVWLLAERVNLSPIITMVAYA
jgi:hypothetical protein